MSIKGKGSAEKDKQKLVINFCKLDFVKIIKWVTIRNRVKCTERLNKQYWITTEI